VAPKTHPTHTNPRSPTKISPDFITSVAIHAASVDAAGLPTEFRGKLVYGWAVAIHAASVDAAGLSNTGSGCRLATIT
jgi:hypothetical protein